MVKVLKVSAVPRHSVSPSTEVIDTDGTKVYVCIVTGVLKTLEEEAQG